MLYPIIPAGFRSWLMEQMRWMIARNFNPTRCLPICSLIHQQCLHISCSICLRCGCLEGCWKMYGEVNVFYFSILPCGLEQLPFIWLCNISGANKYGRASSQANDRYVLKKLGGHIPGTGASGAIMGFSRHLVIYFRIRN